LNKAIYPATRPIPNYFALCIIITIKSKLQMNVYFKRFDDSLNFC